MGDTQLDRDQRTRGTPSVAADRVTRAAGGSDGEVAVNSSLSEGGRPMDAVQVDEVAAVLTARAEARRVSALQTLSSDQQVRLGQCFTPERAASLIADLHVCLRQVDSVCSIRGRAQVHLRLLSLLGYFENVQP